jgi:hypothetical protein
MSTIPSETKPPKLRWFHPTPARLLILLLVIEAILLLSKPWFPKGYAVLIAIASVGVTMMLMLLWLVLALLFHWRFQFSLRSLLVATVAVAIPFSWLAVEMKKAREQREVVEAIRKVGGSGLYDYDRLLPSASRPIWLRKFPSPPWLRKLVGDDFLGNVVTVVWSGDKMTDADLANLQLFPTLKCLSLFGTKVSSPLKKSLVGVAVVLPPPFVRKRQRIASDYANVRRNGWGQMPS